MNTKKYLPTLVCGFGAAVLATIPGIKNFSCCLLVPGASVFAILLDKKITSSKEKVNIGKGIGYGFLTGLAATLFITLFEMLVTYFTRTNEFVENLPQSEIIIRQWNLGPIFNDSLKLLRGITKEIEKSGFSFLYLFLIFSSNFVINSIFGMLGGILGSNMANRNLNNEGN